MMGLTEKQAKLLAFIEGHIHENDTSPSFEQMKDHLGLASKSGVHRLVCSLEERGYIRRLRHRARAIEIVSVGEKHQLTAQRELRARDLLNASRMALSSLPAGHERMALSSAIRNYEDAQVVAK